MQVNIIFFGYMSEMTGSSRISVADVEDTDGLVKRLHDLYPAIKNAKYLIAVDKQVITENTLLKDDHTVALLPPYAGG